MDTSFRQPLYVGSELTVFDSYLLILQYALRHSLTKSATADLLDLMAMHLPSGQSVSHYKLRKFFVDLFSDITCDTHYCCKKRHRPVENASATCANGCQEGLIDFITIPVAAQLKRKKKSVCNFLVNTHALH